MSLFSEREVKGALAFLLLSGLLVLAFMLAERRPQPAFDTEIEQVMEQRDTLFV